MAFKDNPLTFLLSTAVLLVTTSSFLALSVSLHCAYLWLAVVFVALIFLATFTCTYSLPGYLVQDVPQDCPGTAPTPTPVDGHTNVAAEGDTNIPYWVAIDMTDLPPPYDIVAGILPPSYSKATSGEIKLQLVEEPVQPSVETV